MKSLKKTLLGFITGATIALSSGASQAVEIDYWQYFYQTRVTAIDILIEQFEAENPDITVKQTNFPYADYRLKVAKAGANRTSVTFMDNESVPFEANQVSDLYSAFAEVMSEDNLDI